MDKYSSFSALSRHEVSGVDYQVLARQARPTFVIVAPHGGGIEPGTSELADAIAASDFSFHALEGLKPRGNTDLHITSTRFDEPMCLALLAQSTVAVTLHGERSDDEADGVLVGGLNDELADRIGGALAREGFDVRTPDDPGLQGLEPDNICNLGTAGAGVQLEVSRSVRKTMFESLTPNGRKHPTERFDAFVKAIRRSLASAER
ncbi:MAG TPA: poly-gamma-glutamate hydrolase family protein [Vicinamibacterales bacterium]|jgi:phage replication-related protein YjqB (UPF0714/DUF867 family)